MSQLGKEIKIFALNSSRPLAGKIADKVGVKPGRSGVKRLSDGEIQISIDESVCGKDVYLIQSTSAPVDNNLAELLITIDAIKYALARSVNLAMPYYEYARQGRKTCAREPTTAGLVANMLQKAGADQVLSLDLHTPQIQGFFNVPVDNLVDALLLADYFLSYELKRNAVVVSPDHGGVTRARKLAESLRTPITVVGKRYPKANVAEVMNIIDDVKGKCAVIIDDMIDTTDAITLTSQALMDAGATKVYASTTRTILSGSTIERLNNSPIKKLILTDSIDQPGERDLPKAEIVSVGPLMSETIKLIQERKPISPPFNTRFQSHN